MQAGAGSKACPGLFLFLKELLSAALRVILNSGNWLSGPAEEEIWHR